MKYRCDACNKNCVLEQMGGTPAPTGCPSGYLGDKNGWVFWIEIEL
jgi:hypothetical protein